MPRARDWRCACRAAASAVLLALLSAAGHAAGIGQVVHVSGALFAKKATGASRVLGVNAEVERGDVLVTGRESVARIRFVDRGEVTLRPDSQLRVTYYAYDENRPDGDSSILNLIKGGLRAVTGLIGKRNPQTVRLDTIVATIGVRGTDYGVLLCQDDCADILAAQGSPPPPNGLHADVAEGVVVMKNGAGEHVLTKGMFGYVASATTPPVEVPNGVSHIAIPPTGPGGGSGDGPPGNAESCEIP